MDYNTYVSQLANLMASTTSDPNFQTFLPGCIDYANNRILRELDPVAASVINSTGVFAVNNRIFNLPVPTDGSFIVVEEMSAITPSTATAATGTRNPLQFVSKQIIDTIYPSATIGTSVPKYAYLLSNTQIMVGPAADQAYPVEIIGTVRLSPPSSSNTNTYVLTSYPDLFIAASMVFATGYQRDFGSQSDNPAQAVSWEGQYQTLMKFASEEEARAKYESQGWTSESSPNATPPRM